MKSAFNHISKRVRDVSAHEGVRRYFFNTGWMFAEKGLRLVAGLFIGAYVARYLGAAQYGLLNYAISLAAIFSAVASLGFEALVVRELLRNPTKTDAILGTAFVLKLLAAVTMIALLIGVVLLIETDALTIWMVCIIGTGMIFEAFLVIDFFFQSKVWAKYIVWSQMIALSTVSVFRVVLVLNEASLVWFAWTSVLDLFVVSLGLLFFYFKNSFSIWSWKVDNQMAKDLLRSSWSVIIATMAVTIYLRIDQVMVKWMLGDEANGIYGVAVRLSELWNFIPMAICASVFPAILNAKTVSESMYNRRMQWLYDLMVALSVTIAIPMCLLSDYVVAILFGSDYAGAGAIINWYIWAAVFVFLGVANGKWVISENLQVFRMVILIISCLLNIVLNYVLIKSIGLNGAAISTLISYAFAGYFGFLFTKTTRPVFYSMTRAFNPFRVFLNLFGQQKNDL